MVNLETNTAQSIVNPKALLLDWDQINMKKRTDFVSKLDIPDDIKILASGKDILWAPDEKKFLYKITNGTKLQYKVYNMEKPLPIGEKVETLVFETEAAAPQPSLSWYSDSFHLILTEGSTPPDTRGVISLIRIDGSNKTEIYSNTMYSPNVYSAPGGDKIVILTSFKSGDQTDLYTVGIR